MGCSAGKELDDERWKRYDPRFESSEDDYSDCASSDDEVAPRLKDSTRRDKITKASQDLRSAVDDALAQLNEPSSESVSFDRVKLVVRLFPRDSDIEREALTRYWGLGSNKWRECIDLKHAVHGRHVYDLCLHHGNGMRKEIGYLTSMYDAWRYAGDELGFKSGEHSWRGLHFLAMQHPGNDFLNGRYRTLRQGNRAYVSSSVDAGKHTAEAFERMPRRLCFLEKITKDMTGITDSERRDYSHVRNMPGIRRKMMRRYMRQYISEFYRSVGLAPVSAESVHAALAAGQLRLVMHDTVPESPDGASSIPFERRHLPPCPLPLRAAAPAAASESASSVDASSPPAASPSAAEPIQPARTDVKARREWTPPFAALEIPAEWTKGYPPPRDDVIHAATVLHQRLSRMEPSRDGNTRTMVVLINKLLTECGLHPAIFEWPDGAAILTHDAWAKALQESLARWEAARSGADNFSEAELPEQWRPCANGGKPVVDLRFKKPYAGAPKVMVDDYEKIVKKADEFVTAQVARRPWFDDEYLRCYRAQRHAEALAEESVLGPTAPPTRRLFESAVEMDYTQTNPFFSQ
jgi:hypothetical protein